MLDIGLKEWAIICDLLLTGEMALLLRKGGIHERGGAGVFELEHPRFVLYPSWAHQKPAMLKDEYGERVAIIEEPRTVTFHGVGEAARIWQVPGRAAFDELEDLHPWSRGQIDMRFGYKPDRPLYLLAVRARRLARPESRKVHWSYAGCKSWVPLKGEPIDDAGAAPVLSDERMRGIIGRVDEAFSL